MPEKSLSENYEEYYDKASIIPQQTDLEEVRLFSSLVRSNRSLEILDIGCAEGRLAVDLALKGHKVTVADVTHHYLNQALQWARENVVEIGAVKCNIEESTDQFHGRRFDVIFFMNIIEHLKNPVFGLVNIRKLMKDEGILFIHTPNVFNFSRFFRYLFKRKKLVDYYDVRNLKDYHFQTYDYMTLEKTLNFIGLKVDKILPTNLTLPIAHYFNIYNNHISKCLSKQFPFLSDTLLLQCRKVSPIDLDEQISYWNRNERNS